MMEVRRGRRDGDRAERLKRWTKRHGRTPAAALGVCAFAGVLAGCTDDPTGTVPVAAESPVGLFGAHAAAELLPVVYVNDCAIDVYTDDLVMALASTGEIRLEAMVTQSSVAPFNPFVSREDFEQFVTFREEGADSARASGLEGIPDPIVGPAAHLERPPSGRIEDTEPIGGEATERIVALAREATPDEPLIVIVGGTLTSVADAYLHDPGIADRVVVAYLGGTSEHMGHYNGRMDPWAANIVLQRMRLLIFPVDLPDPSVTKERLASDLPDTPLQRWMLSKQHATNVLPDDRDADASPLIALVEDSYTGDSHSVSFSGFVKLNGREVPGFQPDPNGNARVVTSASREAATDVWWHAVEDALESD